MIRWITLLGCFATIFAPLALSSARAAEAPKNPMIDWSIVAELNASIPIPVTTAEVYGHLLQHPKSNEAKAVLLLRKRLNQFLQSTLISPQKDPYFIAVLREQVDRSNGYQGSAGAVQASAEYHRELEHQAEEKTGDHRELLEQLTMEDIAYSLRHATSKNLNLCAEAASGLKLLENLSGGSLPIGIEHHNAVLFLYFVFLQGEMDHMVCNGKITESIQTQYFALPYGLPPLEPYSHWEFVPKYGRNDPTAGGLRAFVPDYGTVYFDAWDTTRLPRDHFFQWDTPTRTAVSPDRPDSQKLLELWSKRVEKAFR